MHVTVHSDLFRNIDIICDLLMLIWFYPFLCEFFAYESGFMVFTLPG
jgi:hypothetical protein